MYIFLHFVTIGTYIFPPSLGHQALFRFKSYTFRPSDVSHFLKMLDLAYQKYPSNYLKLFSIKKTKQTKVLKNCLKNKNRSNEKFP